MLKADNEILGTINELTEEIEFTIDVPKELLKDGKFSTYALAYADKPVVSDKAKTEDNTNTMLYVKLATITLLGYVFKTKESK